MSVEYHDRKTQLLREGRHYREATAQAKAVVAQAMSNKSLIQLALESALGIGPRPPGQHVRLMLPFAMSGLSYLLRRRLFLPAIGLGVVAVAAYAIAVRRQN